ncbi:MAG: HAD-IC family P-type ATPase, partial [Tannerella sp.]|nr:HAD-IC family P-type ATPase [Tannerella sp.]
MKKVSVKVHGMHCAACASHVKGTLEKGGTRDVSVNPATGDVSFTVDEKTERKLPSIYKSIEKLGYTVSHGEEPPSPTPFYRSLLFRFLCCAGLTVPLLLHMIWPDSVLGNPYLQALLSLPVYVTGLLTFGKPAIRSLRNLMPDMNVLTLLGATAAWVYSLTGLHLHALHAHQYLFFESAASIITLILLGRCIEEHVIRRTSSAIAGLVGLQKTVAKKVLSDRGTERVIEVDNALLQVGDVVLVNEGDRVPADGCITWGEAFANESMLTGESDWIGKYAGDGLTGGTLLETGAVRMCVTAVGDDAALSRIIELVRQAQNEKTGMQLLADRISSIFVPATLLIAVLTFGVWYGLIGVPFADAWMTGISVVVIAC